MKKIYPLFLFVIAAHYGFSQTTFNRVYSILQTNCVNSCHNTANQLGGLDFSGSEQAVYAALVNVTPSNAAAAAKGN